MVAIRFGLSAVKNVGEGVVEAMVREREANGSYRDLADLCSRVLDKDFNKKSLESLVRAGALDAFGERGHLLANLDTLLAYNREAGRDRASGQSSIFGVVASRVTIALRPAEAAPQRLVLAWEKELLGLYLSAHPFAASGAVLGAAITTIAGVKEHGADGDAVTFGGVIVRSKRILTKKGEPMLFAEVEDATAAVEVVVFPRTLEGNPQVWLDGTIVLVRGKRSDKDGTPKVLADRAAQVIPGREQDALEAVGVTGGGAATRASERRLSIRLPSSAGPEQLTSIRSVLLAYPGAVVVRLRFASGRMLNTGLRVTPSLELRHALEAILGVPDVVTDEAVASVEEGVVY